MTLDEQIEILQAAKRGEKIERLKGGTTPEWVELYRSAKDYVYDFAHEKYRIADPYAELKAAAKDPTKEIRCIANTAGNTEWLGSEMQSWKWNYPPALYEIRDKPKDKKVVKYLCYEALSGHLKWRNENRPFSEEWHRRPAFDKECEVEDD